MLCLDLLFKIYINLSSSSLTMHADLATEGVGGGLMSYLSNVGPADDHLCVDICDYSSDGGASALPLPPASNLARI